MDEGVSRGVADQEDTHAAAAQGVQEGHAGHGQGCKGAIWTVVPTFRGHAGQAGACVQLRVHIPRWGKEARQLHPHNSADAGGGRGGRDDPQPAGRAVQGGGQAVFAAECTGEASISKGGLEVLAAETRTSSVEGFSEKKIITLGGRQKNYLSVTYDRGDLPITPAHHPLSRLYLEEAHKVDHAGVNAMVMRSRSQVWITRVRPKAGIVKRA